MHFSDTPTTVAGHLRVSDVTGQLENLGGFTGFPAKAFGPGSDIEKYILAALVVPKS